MKKIKVNFVDFWGSFNPNDNFILDALKKNFDVELSDNPDFLFCSSFGKKFLKYDCVRIHYEGENLSPDFNLYDYALGFAYISFDDRYLRLPHYVLYPDACKMALAKHTLTDEEYKKHDKFCNYVISNAISSPERSSMIRVLETYKKVDSGGKYKNNVGGPVKDKIEFEKSYKFTMAIENSPSNGYTTEKIIEAFAGATIPIYYGSKDIAKEFNEKAFINCHNYNSFEEVLERVKEIDNNDEMFLSMVKEPIITADSQANIYLNENYLSDYLKKICSNDPKEAFRRNRYYIGKRFEDTARMHAKLDRILLLPKRALYSIKNKIERMK